MLHGQQGVDLGGVEPQTGQLELAARMCRASLVEVATRLRIPDQRGVEAVAQVLDVALERRRGDFQGFLHLCEGHDLAFADELVDLVEAFGAVHVPYPCDLLLFPLPGGDSNERA